MRFIIYDWAGNQPFPSESFDSFQDAWDFLLSRFTEDEDLGEFYVEVKS